MTNVKALAMFSGGLDSILAVKLIQGQGIDVVGLNFFGFFCSCKSVNGASEAAKRLGLPLKIVEVDKRYLRMLRNPKYGYGRNMNPCVDCKIFMLKEARNYARKIGASFIFTGEVLGERPKSQHYPALRVIEEDAGLKGRLVRPLSARLLPETDAEKNGLLNRAKLLSIQGRSRKPQIALARELGVRDFPSPAGGCLLTEPEFAKRLRDLFQHRKRISVRDVALLRFGRHFRFGENKIIVGRNENENKTLVGGKNESDYLFEVSDVPGPITVLQGKKTRRAIKMAAELTALYSDCKTGILSVCFGKNLMGKTIFVKAPRKADVDELRI